MKEKQLDELIAYVDAQNLNLDNVSDISLFSGLSGVALYYLEMGKFTGNPSHLQKGQDLVFSIIDNLNSENPKLKNYYSFCGGLAGVAYTLNYALKNQLLETEIEESLSEIDDFLFSAASKELAALNTDYLHGALGVMYYFTKRQLTPDIQHYISTLVEQYILSAEVTGNIARVKNTTLREQRDQEYNLGLSHGLCGHLLILSNLLLQQQIPGIADFIQKGLNYIKASRREITGHRNSHYPGAIDEEAPATAAHNEHFYNLRLGWCYGDLNQALLFMKFGLNFNNDGLLREGITLGRATLSKKTLKEAHIKDPFFCHGTSGLAYYYHTLYSHSADSAFQGAAQYWQEQTFAHYRNILDALEPEKAYGLLEGLPGMILASQAIEKNRKFSFDEIFLLN